MRITRRRLLLGATLGGLSACTAPPPPPGAGDDEAGVVADGLEVPWSLVFHEGAALVSERDSGRILEVSEQDGAVRELAVLEDVAVRGEGGLLGLAVLDGHLYAYLTTAQDNRIVRMPLSGAAGSLALGTPETIVGGIAAAQIHDGGRLGVGPDGMLYATVGDAGSPDAAQDPGSPNGSILRMMPDGSAPADNPRAGSLVWSWGHRNPQGIAWDEAGTMYAGEFGQSTWDELNIIEPGANYGWPLVEGVGEDGRFRDPIAQWAPAEASPSGIAIAQGTVHLANLRGRRLRGVDLADPSRQSERLVGTHGRLRDVVLAPDGSLWVLTGNTDGRGDPAPGDDRILRIAAS